MRGIDRGTGRDNDHRPRRDRPGEPHRPAGQEERTVAGTLTGALIAVEFLTPLRLRRAQRYDDRTFGEALGWYPLVGLLLGLALLLLDRALGALLPPVPVAGLLVAALALLSGGLHLDGVADTADGMALQTADRAERLGVMSEGNTGPAGVMALVLVLLLQWAALVSLPEPVRGAAILAGPVLARWTVVPVALLFAPARPKGVGHTMHQALWPVAAPLSSGIALVVALVLLGVGGLVVMALAALGAVIIAGAAARLLDGVTGDTFGASIEVAQVVAWLSIVASASHGWLEPTRLGGWL